MELAAALEQTPVVAIIRLGDSGGAARAARAVVDGGVPAVEITLTTPGALESLARLSAELGDAVCAGAGSVRTADDARRAIGAGARYLVTPVLAVPVIEAGAAAGVPVVCGGFTPTELATAQAAGAYAVKVFPANVLGPGYLRDVLAPMPDLRLVPTGGVDATNLAAYVRAGAIAVGVGSALVDAGSVARGDWDVLQARAAALAASVPVG